MHTKKPSLGERLMRFLAPKTEGERRQFRVALAKGRLEAQRLTRSAHELEAHAGRRKPPPPQ